MIVTERSHLSVEVVAVQKICHEQYYMYKHMYNAFWVQEREKEKEKCRWYIRETIRPATFVSFPPRWHRSRQVNPHQVADFIIRQLIIGSLMVYRWFIDVNERRRENIAAP